MMDGPRFDQLTRRLAAHSSRRRLLQLLGGGLATGLAAARPLAAAAKPPPDSGGGCSTCACLRYEKKTGRCVSRCDAADGEACVDGDCQVVCPDQPFCLREASLCEGSGCSCRAQNKECVYIARVSQTCCCDATRCECGGGGPPLCCAVGFTCSGNCCLHPTDPTQSYCVPSPIFTIGR